MTADCIAFIETSNRSIRVLLHRVIKMYRSLQITMVCAVFVVVAPGATFGGVIEVGDLNIINDPGTPSNGLRYLDMTFSDGLTLATALANAQLTYPNARLANPAEWDDLIAAAAITSVGPLTASDAFTTDIGLLSSGVSYDGGLLSATLGYTASPWTYVWADPAAVSTRGYLALGTTQASLNATAAVPSHPNLGWLLVSEVAAVPEPSSLMLLGIGAVGLLGYRLRRKSKQSRVTS